MMSNIKIQRAGQGIPSLRIRIYAAADLERSAWPKEISNLVEQRSWTKIEQEYQQQRMHLSDADMRSQ